MKHVGEVAFRGSQDRVGRRHLAFLSLGGFTHLAFARAVEPLRLANLASGRTLFAGRMLSMDDAPAASSSGIQASADAPVSQLQRGEVLVVGGGLPNTGPDKSQTIARLRHERAQGRDIMAICGAVSVIAETVIAETGPADDMDCAVHWQIAPAFAERFAKARISLSAFKMGRIPTASGGTAAADLILALIRTPHGDDQRPLRHSTGQYQV